MSSKLAPRGVRPWWRDAVTYQIYIRSFADSNGDGIGDVEGIRSKLPYLQKLGVDAIWITPWYPSPQNDHGYDVSDYLNIEPDYGTLKDAERLISDAHDHGIKIIIDIVPITPQINMPGSKPRSKQNQDHRKEIVTFSVMAKVQMVICRRITGKQYLADQHGIGSLSPMELWDSGISISLLSNNLM